jgi:hypothetical protein
MLSRKVRAIPMSIKEFRGIAKRLKENVTERAM